jgi:Glycine zipper
MKTTLALLVALFVATSGQAQIFRPHARSGQGGHTHRHGPSVSIGYHSGYRPAYFGAGYGRGFGYRGVYRSPNLGYYSYYPGYDIGYYPYANYGAYGTGYDSPVYQGTGSAASNGLWLGALAGGIIGHNSGDFRHNGWRGAAWGAGLGWLIGSVVDANRRVVASPQYGAVPSVAAAQSYAAAAAQTQPVTIINNYYNAPATPMSAANALFGR